MQTKKCQGCGSWMHNEIDQVGYTPKDWKTVELCQSCYQLKHYQTVPKINPESVTSLPVSDLGFELNQKIHSPFFLSVVVTDIYNLGFLNQIENYKIAKNVLVCVNKEDLINHYQKTLLKFIWSKKLAELNFNFEIVFLSAKLNCGINALIRHLQNFKEVCFIGNSAVGKSYLVNQICKKFGVDSQILIGSYLNTTKNIIANKIDKIKILDTPGSLRKSGVFHHLEPEVIKKMQDSGWHKKVYQLGSSRYFFLENYAVIGVKFLINHKFQASCVFSCSKVLNLIHTKAEKFNPNLLNAFPNLKKYPQVINWKKHTFKINEKTHFVIDDLTWFDVNVNELCEVEVYLPDDVLITKFVYWEKQIEK